ncbi:hypothetical protein [Martelella soudanensis]|uniref:hypothetical protein n=1 Tax=unclassified Martelella TaxID=2629616 RepID=UPI0015DE499B|nr:MULTISPECIES: hypothetical protein [unclassified Martelella]
MEESRITDLILKRIDEVAKGVDRLDHRLEDSEVRASESRRGMHQRQETHERELLRINHRLENVEKAVNDAAPTLEDYALKKAQVEGAGRLGRMLWVAGGFLLAIAVWLVGQKENIWSWLSSR